MKDNKPLLFINSAQSSEFKDQNQYVYDSRFDNKEHKKIIRELKKEAKLNEVKNFNQEVNQQSEKKIKENSVIQELNKEDEMRIHKLFNKMELLNKRAKLGRFVLVSVETFDYAIEGYFIQLHEESILIRVDEEEKEISLQDIKDIIIIKV